MELSRGAEVKQRVRSRGFEITNLNLGNLVNFCNQKTN